MPATKEQSERIFRLVKSEKTSVLEEWLKSLTDEIKDDLLNKRNLDGYTPLHIAYVKGNFELSKLLLTHGGDPEVKENEGNTSLHVACHGDSKPCKELVDLIMNFSKDKEGLIHATNDQGETALCNSTYILNQLLSSSIVKYLLENKADPNIGDGPSSPLIASIVRKPAYRNDEVIK